MRRTLIVDDQRDVRQMLRAGLETLGPDMHVVDVPSAEEAMLVISSQPFDLLIVDIYLPGISGFELRKRARNLNPNLKMILITGRTEPKTRSEVMSADVDAYFFKPVPMPEFLKTAEELLGGQTPASPPAASPQVTESPARAETPLTNRLEELRQESKARACLLFDCDQQVLAQAGELPFEDIQSLISGLWGVLQAADKLQAAGKLQAADKLQAANGGSNGIDVLSHIHYFHGPGFDLFAAPAGSRLGFLLVADPVTGAARLGEVQRAILAAVPGLEVLVGSSALEGQPASAEMQRSAAQPGSPGDGLEYRAAEMDELRKPDPPPAGPAVMSEIDLDELFQAPEPPPPVEVEDLPSLEDLFGEAAEKAAAMDADAFWEEIASDNPDPSLNPHAISYDEAREIGLSPDEN